MAQQRSTDPRDQADASVLRNNLTYSLGQLRLVGLLGLVVVLAQLLTLLLALTGADPQQRLEALLHFSPWLLLLPIAVGLYFLGGGHHRLRREHRLLEVAHAGLLPLGLACLLVVPGLATHNWLALHNTRQQAEIRSREIPSPDLPPGTTGPAPAPLSPYQRRLFDSRSLLSADLMAALAGGGLLLLQRQSRRTIARHGLTPGLFFRSGPAPQRRRHL